MKHDIVFTLSVDELTALATRQLASDNNLKPAYVGTKLHIRTDGKTARVTGATVTFSSHNVEEHENG